VRHSDDGSRLNTSRAWLGTDVPSTFEKLVLELEEEMFTAAEELRFEYAAKLRYEIK